MNTCVATREQIDDYLRSWQEGNPGRWPPSRSEAKLNVELMLLEMAVFGRLLREPKQVGKVYPQP